MKKILFVLLLALAALPLSGFFSSAHSAVMQDYCLAPPVISQPVDPNILLVLDSSGSMGWAAYSYGDSDSNGDGILDGYNPTVSYEGYFIPGKTYKPDVNGVYEETVGTGIPCTITCVSWRCRRSDIGGCEQNAHGCTSGRNRWACCDQQVASGDCNLQTGNYLNYEHMQRIDLLRWAMTGGTPSSCTGAQTFNTGYCDPELWNQPGNDTKVGQVCNNTLDVNGDGIAEGGCILMGGDGTKVKVPWSRVNGGLTSTFKELEMRPRMGSLAFGGTGVVDKVYLGDFTSANSTNDLFPYMNLITHVNSLNASGTTPTGRAMWDTLNYFQQNASLYGGFTPEMGGGDHWKNPMYICTQGGVNCSFVPCAGNYVILMSDGQWNNPSCTIGNLGVDPCTSASSDPVVPASCMHKLFANNQSGTPAATTKVNAVYTIGLFLGGTGEQALKNVAMYGSFDNAAKLWPDSLNNFPAGSCGPVADCCTSSNCGTGSSCTPLPASSNDWDKNADGVPDTFYKSDNALGIKNTILNAVLDILRRATSGTAVSILASGEGSGANLLQAFFYPKKGFEDQEISWIGEMQNLWYYIDPKLQRSTIREDSVADYQLQLVNDKVVRFRFDSTLNKTVADRYQDAYDVNNNWISSTFVDSVDLENTNKLWEAGRILWRRSLLTAPRSLYTTTTGNSLISFNAGNAVVLQNYLQAATPAESANIINYVYGLDIAGYRSRTVTIPVEDNTPRVWKLGDIISSTPKMQSWIRLDTYNSEPPIGYNDGSYDKYVGSLNYKTRGMVYAGANDGMLHAFELGTPEAINSRTDKLLIERLCDDTNNDGKCAGETSTANLGKEMWSYIPKNALPYLRYLTDPDYCHLYYVDATPYLFDASINAPSDCTTGDYSTCPKKTVFMRDALGNDTKNLDSAKTSWRTILIGGMGLGGACRIGSSTCTDCVKTPTMDPVDNTKGLGYSSYFALDITDPQNPSLLWEFSDPGLGFSTSGPAIVRVGEKDKNGNWFAVFASGPTGPIDTVARQFVGSSDQNLKFFVLDLKTGTLVRTIDTGIVNAFGGALINSTIDTDRWRPDRDGNYKDDVFYAGYTQKSGSNWVGGVLRISTKQDINPNNWSTSALMSGIGPVTAAIAHLQDRTKHRLWIYFGSGRYFYKVGATIDDPDSLQTIYGVKEPCYLVDADRFDETCTASASGLTNATTSPPTSEPASGWYISLDASTASYKAERVITSPLAAFTGGVFFTTFAPTAEICGFSGNSYLWGVDYVTGGSAPSSSLAGTALVQVSTGEIKEIDLATAFTEKIPSGGTQGRRTAAFQGMPPKGQGLSVVINPRPMKKVLHMQER